MIIPKSVLNKIDGRVLLYSPYYAVSQGSCNTNDWAAHNEHFKIQYQMGDGDIRYGYLILDTDERRDTGVYKEYATWISGASKEEEELCKRSKRVWWPYIGEK